MSPVALERETLLGKEGKEVAGSALGWTGNSGKWHSLGNLHRFAEGLACTCQAHLISEAPAVRVFFTVLIQLSSSAMQIATGRTLSFQVLDLILLSIAHRD